MTDLEPNRHRRAARARWDRLDPDERREATAPAVSSRRKVADVSEQLDALGVDLMTEIRALRAEVADLRQQQVAA